MVLLFLEKLLLFLPHSIKDFLVTSDFSRITNSFADFFSISRQFLFFSETKMGPSSCFKLCAIRNLNSPFFAD